jgi:hypothetical protein
MSNFNLSFNYIPSITSLMFLRFILELALVAPRSMPLRVHLRSQLLSDSLIEDIRPTVPHTSNLRTRYTHILSIAGEQ